MAVSGALLVATTIRNAPSCFDCARPSSAEPALATFVAVSTILGLVLTTIAIGLQIDHRCMFDIPKKVLMNNR